MVSSTPMWQRIVTFALAVMFIVSTIGIVVYYVMVDKKTRQDQAALNSALEQQQNKPNDQQQPEEGKLKGTQLANFTPTPDIPELKTITVTPGSGDATVKASDTVTVNYTGALASTGIIFESSLDSGNPATFPLSGVIKGWTDGIPGMKVGETRRLLIPSDMAYGSGGNGTIPPDSDLVFDVTLIKIGQ
jgi:FKBP-type peptidyl-prolyl cis-trans isomerase